MRGTLYPLYILVLATWARHHSTLSTYFLLGRSLRLWRLPLEEGSGPAVLSRRGERREQVTTSGAGSGATQVLPEGNWRNSSRLKGSVGLLSKGLRYLDTSVPTQATREAVGEKRKGRNLLEHIPFTYMSHTPPQSTKSITIKAV